MNGILVGGCAAGGGLIGPFLASVAAKIPPAKPSESLHLKVEDVELGGDLAGESLEVSQEAELVALGSASKGLRLLCALVTAVLFGALAIRFGAVPQLCAYCVLGAGLVAISVTDFRVGLVPRRFVYPTAVGLVIALVAASITESLPHNLIHAIVGGLVPFVLFFAIWWISPRAMGFGDVRLAFVTGIGLGWIGYGADYIGFAASFVAGSVLGVVKMLVEGTGRKTTLPFGPGLAVGAVIGVLFGAHLYSVFFANGI